MIDDAVLTRARQRALDEGTSVNAEVRAFLTRYAASSSGFAEFLDLSEALDATSGPGGRTWRRAELHERGAARVTSRATSPRGGRLES